MSKTALRSNACVLCQLACIGVAISVSSAAAREALVPSTVSKRAAEIIRNVKPGGETAASKAEWQALS